MSAIKYRALEQSRSEIRLIRLSPRARNQTAQAPKCNLFHSSLLKKPVYTALSYTWGSPLDTCLLEVDEVFVPVTKNLYSALQGLRCDTIRIVWIDALCINQFDDVEKGWQVQLMQDIYREASSVSIWLGPADTTSDMTIEYLKILGTKALRFDPDGGPGIIRNVSEQWKKLIDHPPSFRDRSTQRVTLKSQHPDQPDIYFLMGELNDLYYSISGDHGREWLLPMEGITSLFRREWWSRIWVLQELTLAREAEFVCGAKRISRRQLTAAWSTFEALRKVMWWKPKARTADAYRKSITQAMFDWRASIQLNMWNIHRYSPYPLLALLRVTCTAADTKSFQSFGLEATDPRDKIYGLFGLASDRTELVSMGFLPDYTKTCLETYVSATTAMLKQGHMAVLSLNQFPKRPIGLPSWVPDWAQPSTSSLRSMDVDHMTFEQKFSADKSSRYMTPKIVTSGDHSIASVCGHVYDEIHLTGVDWRGGYRPAKLGNSARPDLKAARRLIRNLVQLSFQKGSAYKTLQDRVGAAGRTVIAEIGQNKAGKWVRIGDGRRGIANWLWNSSFIDYIRIYDILWALNLLGYATCVMQYIGEIVAKMDGRRTFITTKGNMGLGPKYIRSGDVVAIIAGSQVPFVLRKSVGRRFEIVGEAYVDGIMNGEAVMGSGVQDTGRLELI